jgi:general nucleoside transport system permease protein
MHSATILIGSGVMLAVLLLFAALGELVAENAGTLNISVEAMMLSGAYAAGAAAHSASSPVAGVAAGVAAGGAVAFVQANLSHRAKLDQFVVGLVLVILVQGVTSFLIGATNLTVVPSAGNFTIPGLASIPLIGAALFNQPWSFYAIYLLLPFTAWLLYRTRWGLEVRASGENPGAAKVSGVNVGRRRREAIYFCGLLSGYAGAFLAIGIVGAVSIQMTAGMGYIAIAAVLLGGWTVRGTVLACAIFGAVEGAAVALPSLGVTVNSQLLTAAPYLVVLALAPLIARRRSQPAALGLPM